MSTTQSGTQGMSRTLRQGRTTHYEFLRLTLNRDGRMDFIAQPSNQPEARFRLIALENKRAVFENPTHDFPTRIVYELTEPNRLHVRIAGTLNGKAKNIEYPFRRTDCPTS